jgi:hypothetical protein
MRSIATMCCLLAALGLASLSPAAEKGRQLSVQSPSGEFPGWKSFSAELGTTTGQVWKLGADGVLECRGKPLGYLYTEKDYGDFTLRLEWRWPEGKPGKGGVLLRKTGLDKIWPKSLEAQINAPDAGDFWGLGGYALSGPAERLRQIAHPKFGRLTGLKKTEMLENPAGQWNQYEIRAEGGTVTLVVNGHQVNRATACELSPGRICLTSEGTEIFFRNVELEPGER